MRKTIFILIFMIIFAILRYERSIASSIPEPFIFSVVYIENISSGVAGTGFLVYRQVNETEGRVFLISNKHVLNPKELNVVVAKTEIEKAGINWDEFVGKLAENGWSKVINPEEVRLTVRLDQTKEAMSKVFGGNFDKIFPILQQSLKDVSEIDKEAQATVFLNKLENGEIKAFSISVILRNKDGQELLQRHPNEDVDVAALDLTTYISKNGTLNPELKIGFITEDKFATQDELKNDFVTIGDRVLVLGYPLNLVEGGHCIPIARNGVIASYPLTNFRNLPIIYIDATIVPGSSGSPVFLPWFPYRWTSSNNVNQLEVTQAKLLGIIAQTPIGWSLEIKKTNVIGINPATVSVIDSANLGILFKVETIIDVINEFGYPAWKPPIQDKDKK